MSPGQAADFPATLAVTVTVNISPSIDSLSIDNSGTTLDILAGQTLTVVGGITNNGTITVDFNPNGIPANLTFSGSQTLSGSGSVVMNSPYAQLNTSNSGVLTQAAGHTISGLGTINAALINQGLVNADINGQTLFLMTDAMSSSGTMEAINGGLLNVGTITISNSGGTILASGGNVLLVNSTIVGGTLTSTGTSNLSTTSGGASLSGVTLSAGSQFNIPNNQTVTVTNGLANNGTIVVDYNPNGIPANLTFSGSQTLSGTGSVVMNSPYAQLNTSDSGLLTQAAGHTISGAGTINAALNNQGLVNANANGQTLTLAGSNPASNTSIMEATGGGNFAVAAVLSNSGGTLLAAGGNVQITSGGSVNNAGGGTIQAASGGNVQISGGATIVGGMLTSTGTSSSFSSNGGSTLSGVTFATGSQFNILNNTTVTITNGLSNNGTITVDFNPNGIPANLTFSGSQTLSGSGSVVMNSPYAQLNTSNSGVLTQAAGHTISGLGTINAALINQGLVNADINGQTLFLMTDAMSSSGTMEAINGGLLNVGTITISNSGGTILASGGNVLLVNSTIVGGTLTSTGTSNLSTTSGGASLSGVTLSAGSQFNIPNNQTVTVTNGLANNGTIVVDYNPNGIPANLTFSGSQTLSGTGSVVMNSPYAQLNTSDSGLLTQAAGHTISGAGTINAALNNQGLVNANANGQTLTLATSAKVSSGTMETTNGGVLNITTNINNTGGLILAGSGAVDINSGATISGGTLTSMAGSTFTGNGSAGLNNVVLSASSQYNIPSNQTTTVSGGLINSGTISGDGTLKQVSGPLELGGQGAITAANVQINGGTLLAGGPGNTINSNLIYASPLASTYQGVLAGAGNSLVVNNPTGLLVLSGTNNTIGGGTTINAGTLLISGAGGLPSTAPLTVDGDSSFSVADGTARNTTVSKLTLTNGSNLVFDWVNNVADELISTAAATTSGYVGISVVITGVPNGTQTLITAPSGLQAPNNTKYLLGDAFDYTAVLTQSDTAVGISLYTAVTPLSSAYWLGGLVPGGGNAMALSNASTSNWAASAGGAYANGLIPGPTTDVFFSATGATLQSGIVLGNNMAANSLTFSSTGVTIAADGNELTLFSSGTGAATRHQRQPERHGQRQPGLGVQPDLDDCQRQDPYRRGKHLGDEFADRGGQRHAGPQRHEYL